MSEVTSDQRAARATQLKAAGLEGYHQVYLFSGKVVHSVSPSSSLNGFYPDAVCGQQADPFNPWFGEGTQDEYDEAVRRPLCKECLKR